MSKNERFYYGGEFPELVRNKVPMNDFTDILKSVQQQGENEITQSSLDEFIFRYQNELNELDKAMENANVKKVVLEGGHIYSDEIPDQCHFQSLRLTALLRMHMLKQHIQVHNLLFIDDFHPSKSTLNIETYLKQGLELGWPIDYIVFERDVIPIAEFMLHIIRRIGKVLPSKNGLLLKRNSNENGVHLIKPDDGKHSCALLDSALSLLKYGILDAHGVVNVLCRNWQSQQMNTRRILRTCLEHHRIPFFNFFIDLENDTCVSGSPHFFR